VLLFLEDAPGPDRLWTIETSQSLETVVTALRKLILTPVTVRPEASQNEIWFVDPGGKRSRDLDLFRSEMNARARVAAGTAEMLGNENRETAIKGWQQQIGEFEKQSGGRLSKLITIDAWRNVAEVHTCSKEMSDPF
jgi:hypothetical protein